MRKHQFREITAWQRETFPTSTAQTAIAHLEEEVKELSQDLSTNSPNTAKEFADCFLLLFGAASLAGMGYEDICSAIDDKMEINRKRKWGKPNAKGYVKHIAD